MRFFSDIPCRYQYPVSLVAQIGPGRKYDNSNGYWHEVELTDGRTVRVDGISVDDMTKSVLAIIPAQPGYSAIHFCTDGAEEWISREPVIAWRMTSEDEVHPITIRGVNDGMYRPIDVEKPGGEVWCPTEEATYPSAEAYVASEKERHAAERERRGTASVAKVEP